MKIYLTLLLFLIITSCGIDKESPPPLSSVNNTGELDTTFNGNGYVSYNGMAGGSGDDEVYAMTTDTQGRIVAVGASVNVGGDRDILVIRLTATGELDKTFSGNGSFTLNDAAGGAGDDVAYDVAVDSSNNIFVTGTSLNGSGDFDMFVLKITAAGALDSSFAGTGIFVHNNAAGGVAQHDQGNSIAIDSSGRILVAGFSDQSLTNRDMAVWKLTSSGILDTSFSGDGIFTDDGRAGGEDDIAESLAIDASNNLIIAGRADSLASLSDMAVWKLDASGNLDGGFNGGGFLNINSSAGGNGADSATDIAIDRTGKYFIAGYSRNGDGNNDMVLWKLNPDASLDTTFSADGFVVFDVSSLTGGGVNDIGSALLIDSQDRIVVVGSGDDDMYIWRFNKDGSPDENFNQDGVFSHDSAAGGFTIDSGTSVIEDSLNRVYIGGFSENQSNDFDATFWRLK